MSDLTTARQALRSRDKDGMGKPNGILHNSANTRLAADWVTEALVAASRGDLAEYATCLRLAARVATEAWSNTRGDREAS